MRVHFFLPPFLAAFLAGAAFLVAFLGALAFLGAAFFTAFLDTFLGAAFLGAAALRAIEKKELD